MTTMQRIFLLILIGQAMILGGGSYFEYRKNKELLREVFASRAEITGQSIGIAYGALFCQGKKKEALKFLETYHEKKSFEFALITLGDHKLTVGAKEFSNLADQDIAAQNSILEKSQIFATFAEIPSCKKNEQAGEIQVGYSFEGLSAPLRAQLITQAKVLLAQTLLLFFAIFILGRVMNKHLGLIINRCKKIAEGHLDEEIIFKKQDDFYVVSETLNSMSFSLAKLQKDKEEQRALLVSSSKLSSLGEMAGGVAHEINNPLAIIDGKVAQLRSALKEVEIKPEKVEKLLLSIESMVQRIAKIIRGLRSFSRDGSEDPFEVAAVKTIVDDTVSLCQSKFLQSSVELKLGIIDESLRVECRNTEISQVILNLLNNSFDAILDKDEKWVEIDVIEEDKDILIRVTDSGLGIPLEIQQKMLQPFFTTKPVGKGTGLGLSISIGIARAHHGSLSIDNDCKNTRFVLRLPKAI